MQKERRGFTLIELLAVIVILAIIALIAVPVIMNVIGNARKSAFEDSAYGIVKAGEMYYTNELLENGGMTSDKEFTITNGAFVGEALEVSGSLPSSGKVTVTKEGKVAVALSNGEYCVRKATTESKIQAEKLSDLNGVCDYKKVANPVFTKATGSTNIPACIANNTTCNVVSAGDEGIKVGVKVNDSETKDFYVMSEDTDKNEITLIMAYELNAEAVPWLSQKDYIEAGGTDLSNDGGNCQYGKMCATNDKGPLTVLNYLETETSNWTNIPSRTYELTDENNLYIAMTRTARARLIKHSETLLLGCEDDVNSSCPTWLYINTSSGHWTSSASLEESSSAMFVYYSSGSGGKTIDDALINYDNLYGVRPVITISKTMM